MTRREMGQKLEDAWQLCKGNRDVFADCLTGDGLSLRNLFWLFRHESARRYVQNVLRDIDPEKERDLHACVSAMLPLFDLDVNLNAGGDPDELWRFTQDIRRLLEEAWQQLKKRPVTLTGEIAFTPVLMYLQDLELGAFGFWPLENDDDRASWQT